MRKAHFLISKAIPLLFLIVSFANVAYAEEDQFSSEYLGLITAKQSEDVSRMAIMGLGASGDIRSFVSKDELNKLSTFANSGMLMSSFSMDKPLQDEYLSKISESLSTVKKINYVEINGNLGDIDAGVFTTVSLVPYKSQTIIEVSLIVFDMKKAASKKSGMDGIIESVVWRSVSRKLIDLPSKGIQKDWGADPLVSQSYTMLVKNSFQTFLMSY